MRVITNVRATSQYLAELPEDLEGRVRAGLTLLQLGWTPSPGDEVYMLFFESHRVQGQVQGGYRLEQVTLVQPLSFIHDPIWATDHSEFPRAGTDFILPKAPQPCP